MAMKLLQIVRKWIGRKKSHITFYYAVGIGGQGRIFAEMPSRDSEHWVWVGESDGFLVLVVERMVASGFVLPTISWEDEPVELKLTLGYGRT
jgi:hypothetical protein